MRLNAGSVLLLLSGFVAYVTAPRDRRGDPTMTEVKVSSFFPIGDMGLCPSQCLVELDVMVCHHADGLNMVHLARCISNISFISVVELRSTSDMCSCFLLNYIRMTANEKILTLTPTPCAQILLDECEPMLPDRSRNMEHRGVVAGLVMEQSEAGWRKATRRHLSWIWNKVNSLRSSTARAHYRALVIKTVKSVYWTRSGLMPGVKDRILPFMVFRNGHLGPLYGTGRKGWYPVQDFQPSVEAASGSDWVPVNAFNLLKDEIESKKGVQVEMNVGDQKYSALLKTESKYQQLTAEAEGTVIPIETTSPPYPMGQEDNSLVNYFYNRKIKPNKKRLSIVIAILCLVVAVCILGIIIQVCRRESSHAVRKPKKKKKKPRSFIRRLSRLAWFEDSEEEVMSHEKSLPEPEFPFPIQTVVIRAQVDSRDLHGLWDTHSPCPLLWGISGKVSTHKPSSSFAADGKEESEQGQGKDTKRDSIILKYMYKPEEIKRRLSQPYSQWCEEDFQLAREINEAKAKETSKPDESEAEATLEKVRKSPAEKSQGVHQKVPPEKEALYRQKIMSQLSRSVSKTVHTGRNKGETWTQVNVFDIVSEVRTEEQKERKRPGVEISGAGSKTDVQVLGVNMSSHALSEESKFKDTTNHKLSKPPQSILKTSESQQSRKSSNSKKNVADVIPETSKTKAGVPEFYVPSTGPVYESHRPATNVVPDSQSELPTDATSKSTIQTTDTEPELGKRSPMPSPFDEKVSAAKKTSYLEVMIDERTPGSRQPSAVTSASARKALPIEKEYGAVTKQPGMEKDVETGKELKVQDSRPVGSGFLAAEKLEGHNEQNRMSASAGEVTAIGKASESRLEGHRPESEKKVGQTKEGRGSDQMDQSYDDVKNDNGISNVDIHEKTGLKKEAKARAEEKRGKEKWKEELLAKEGDHDKTKDEALADKNAEKEHDQDKKTGGELADRDTEKDTQPREAVGSVEDDSGSGKKEKPEDKQTKVEKKGSKVGKDKDVDDKEEEHKEVEGKETEGKKDQEQKGKGLENKKEHEVEEKEKETEGKESKGVEKDKETKRAEKKLESGGEQKDKEPNNKKKEHEGEKDKRTKEDEDKHRDERKGNKKKKKKKKGKKGGNLGEKDKPAENESEGGEKKKKKKKNKESGETNKQDKGGESEGREKKKTEGKSGGEQEQETSQHKGKKKSRKKKQKTAQHRQQNRSHSASASSRDSSSASRSSSATCDLTDNEVGKSDTGRLLSRRLLSLVYPGTPEDIYFRSSASDRPSRSPRLREPVKMSSRVDKFKTDEVDREREDKAGLYFDKSKTGDISPEIRTPQVDNLWSAGVLLPSRPNLHQENEKGGWKRRLEGGTGNQQQLSAGLDHGDKRHKSERHCHRLGTTDPKQPRNNETDAEIWKRWFEGDTDSTITQVCLGLHSDSGSDVSGILCYSDVDRGKAESDKTKLRCTSRNREPACPQQPSPTIFFRIHGDARTDRISPFRCPDQSSKTRQRYFKYKTNKEVGSFSEVPKVKQVCLGLHSASDVITSTVSEDNDFKQNNNNLMQSEGLTHLDYNQQSAPQSLSDKNGQFSSPLQRESLPVRHSTGGDVILRHTDHSDTSRINTHKGASEKRRRTEFRIPFHDFESAMDMQNHGRHACPSGTSCDIPKPARKSRGHSDNCDKLLNVQSTSGRSDRQTIKECRKSKHLEPWQFCKKGDQHSTAETGDSPERSIDLWRRGKANEHDESDRKRNTIRQGSPRIDIASTISPSAFNKNSNQQKHSFPCLDREEGEDDVDFCAAFPTLASCSHSLLPSASDIERFASSMRRTSPTLFSEVFSQFEKIQQEQCLQKDWAADTNSSRRDVTPQTSKHTWTYHTQMETSPNRVQSETWNDLSTFSFTRISQCQSYSLGPRTPFSPPDLYETPDASCLEQTAINGHSSTSNTIHLSQVMVPSASSSRSSQPVQDSESSNFSDASACDVSQRRKRRRHSRCLGNDIVSSESQPSFYSTQGSIQ